MADGTKFRYLLIGFPNVRACRLVSADAEQAMARRIRLVSLAVVLPFLVVSQAAAQSVHLKGGRNAEPTACLTSRKALQSVLRDLYDGQGTGVRNIPTFFLFHGGTGYLLAGARSAEDFAATLQQQLENANSGVTGGGPSARP
jgi:hypothetical protein